ncbi:hypothetical protein ACLF3G_05890 [Falsiroseomonas sp. HC035]|uniref:hypothetical protein n=1 Tax=Falsiroseomonas sp. HC035 TaxID=3390999 RepID=UPI003D310FD1
MPFDFLPPGPLPVDAAIHGVPRHALEAHVLQGLAPAQRTALAEIELTAGGHMVHMGVVFEQVAWRAIFRDAGQKVARGSFPVWNGSPA